MARFIVRRILAAVLTLFVVATLTFFLMNMIPGGPFNTERATQKQIAALEAKYNLDKPLFEQYLIYMGKLVRGDLGDSFKRLGFPVVKIVGEKFPVSAQLGLVAILIAVLVGIPAGTYAAFRRNSAVDRVLMLLSTLGISIPSFVMATLMLVLFGSTLKWLPTLGLSSWKHYIMPAVSLSFMPMCHIARLMRSSMLDVLGQDYIKTARAKGLGERVVLFKHAMKNAIIPVVSYLGPMAAGILTGGFVVEKIFTIPGMGKFFVESISNQDYPLVMGATVFYAGLLILMNLVVDLAYGLLDPRIKYE